MVGRSFTSITDPRYKYTDKERDTETGYSYFGARYYDSRIARWMGVDSLAGNYYDVFPFVFKHNLPLVRTDVDGMQDPPKNSGVQTPRLATFSQAGHRQGYRQASLSI